MAPTITSPTAPELSFDAGDLAASALLDLTERCVGASTLGVRDRALRGALMREPQVQIGFDDARGSYELRSTQPV